jgi:hypothetical protein
MNRSYNKIRHIRDANSLLESRTILSEQDDKPTINLNSTYIGNALINKVATEGIKYVTPQMISSPQFKGSYSGYQFGGVFNEVEYTWDCNGVEGMSGIRGMVDGEILTETVENMLAAIKKPVTDAKPGSFCVGFYAPTSKFIIYTNTSNKPMCINF